MWLAAFARMNRYGDCYLPDMPPRHDAFCASVYCLPPRRVPTTQWGICRTVGGAAPSRRIGQSSARRLRGLAN